MKIKERIMVKAVNLQGFKDAKKAEADINEALRELQKDNKHFVISVTLKRTRVLIVYRSNHLETEQLGKKEITTIEEQPQALNHNSIR